MEENGSVEDLEPEESDLEEHLSQKLENIDRMISFTMSGVSEGYARLDKQYFTGESFGLGIKRQYLLNYKFVGLFDSDEPQIGCLRSDFVDIVGQLSEYKVITGRVRFKFAGGYILEGFFRNEIFTGMGVISNPSTGFRLESRFKNGVCEADRSWALVHGDNKHKMHRYCLVKIEDQQEEDEAEEEEYDEDELRN